MSFSVRYMSLSLVYGRLTLVSLPRALHLFGPPGPDVPLDIHLAHACMPDTHRNSSSHACAQQHSGRWSVPSVAEKMESQPLGFIAYKMLSQKLRCGSPPQTSRALHWTNTFLTLYEEFSSMGQDHSAKHMPE